jgi:hypothetical protein
MDQVIHIEKMLRKMAPGCRYLRRIVNISDYNSLNILFVVNGPLYEAETEVIPLYQRILDLNISLDLDFVVVPEHVSSSLEATEGAHVVYEHAASPSR